MKQNSNFQIIIPMSGFGERFRRANYKKPKPIINVLGKPIIQYVCEMFPKETDFLFICNEDHLNNAEYRLRNILKKIMPTGRVVGIKSHKKGPVHAVLQAIDHIDLTKKTIVNYCDFTCDWSWDDFKKHVLEEGCDGSIPAYKGFHPHSLGSTQYAYIQEAGGIALDIKEKEPFTDNRMEEYASSGTYYFRSGFLMKSCFEETVRRNLNVNGEYYVSLAYKELFEKKKNVTVYKIDHFMQWGTPEDLEEYIKWAETFHALNNLPNKTQPQGSVVIPMAGLGERFSNAGYKKTKPLLPISGKTMVEQAISFLPAAQSYSFVLRENMPEKEYLIKKLEESFPDASINLVKKVTEGQAVSAALGLQKLKQVDEPISVPVTFGVCDCGMVYNDRNLEMILSDPKTEIIVWAVRGHIHAIRNPEMYGWIKEHNGKIQKISVKTPLKDPLNDPIVTGVFTFKNDDIFHHVYTNLIKRDGRINGEFYLDSVIKDAIDLGYHCRVFEVDYYISWGTPNDYKTFEYWQNCFDSWNSHKYTKKLDPRHNFPDK